MKHVNLKKLAGLTAAAALTLAPLASLADTAQSALVKGGALNLRETASLSAKVLGQYPTGTLVEIIESGDEWHKVTVNGKTGYMMAKYLNTDVTTAVQTATVRTNTGIGLNLREEPRLSGKLINVNGGSIVNFRKGPSLNSGIIRTVPVGTKVTVLEHGTDWCKVDVDGTIGYISTWFMTPVHD